MAMKKLSPTEFEGIVKKYNLHLCRLKDSDIVNIRKQRNEKMDDISIKDFEAILRKKRLAVFKAEGSDFLKIMKSR